MTDIRTNPDPNILLSRLEKVRKTGPESWMACCPAHDDKSPSLSIGVSSTDGRVLFQCFAGCDWKSILDGAGLSLDDVQDGPIADRLLGGNKRKFQIEQDDKVASERFALDLAAGDRAKGKTLSPNDLKREREAFMYLKKVGAI